MTRTTEVFNILSTLLSRNREQILPSHRLMEDLEIDSLGIVELIIAIEETFEIKLDGTLLTMDRLYTVQDLLDFVSLHHEHQRKIVE